MNTKRVGLGGLVVTLLCLGAARAEDMPAPYTGSAAPPAPAADAAPPPSAPPVPASPLMPSDWVNYPRCMGCCGPVGANGPIEYETYVRSGFDFPLGGNPFGTRLQTGWEIGVGARTLFFNPEKDRAWVADIGVSNVFNGSSDQTSTYQLLNVFDKSAHTVVPEVDAHVRSLNRTYFNLAGGREWYLWGAADCANQDTNWRVGVDLGGRYGTEKLEVTNFRHFTDVNAGIFVAVHSDLEVPTGCCIFLAGLRSEYGYTWSDILQRQNNSDIQDVNLLFNLGVRY